MSNSLEQFVLKTLEPIQHPDTGKSLTHSISKIIVNRDEVIFAIYCENARSGALEPMRKNCEELLLKIEGVSKVKITLTSGPELRQADVNSIPGINRIIAVASGKGGVGKSTIAFNLAITLANQGFKVGLVDADIYGPSLPRLAGISQMPELDDKLMIPHTKFGLKMMSVGFLVDDNAATVWRGPMTTKVLYQLMRMTKWAGKTPLDILIVDTPPGTGDVHLSLAENYKLDGAIVVTTPQELAAADARKGINMYNKLSVPVLGIVENMSYFKSPSGEKHHIFGQNAGVGLAKEFKLPLLAQIPINQELAESSDTAKPICYYQPAGELAGLFKPLARIAIGKTC